MAATILFHQPYGGNYRHLSTSALVPADAGLALFGVGNSYIFYSIVFFLPVLQNQRARIRGFNLTKSTAHIQQFSFDIFGGVLFEVKIDFKTKLYQRSASTNKMD